MERKGQERKGKERNGKETPITFSRKGGDLGDAGLHYSPDAPANIPSFSSLHRAGIKFKYDNGADIWIVRGKTDKTAQFRCSQEGLYVCSIFNAIHSAHFTTVAKN